MLKTIQFYATSTYDCGYLPPRQARSLVAAPSHQVTAPIYDSLIDLGFRRSGILTYRPHCDQCQACTPIRVNTAEFTPSRNHRRTMKKFQHLQPVHKPLEWNEEHYALYREYQAVRHSGSDMDNDDKSQYIEFILSSQLNSKLIEFREGEQLKMVALVDEVAHGWSAVYTFFDPHTAGLGTYAILWQLNYCKEVQLPWLYLGYWIKESPKMAYKTRFTPYQLFINNHWAYPDLDT